MCIFLDFRAIKWRDQKFPLSYICNFVIRLLVESENRAKKNKNKLDWAKSGFKHRTQNKNWFTCSNAICEEEDNE